MKRSRSNATELAIRARTSRPTLSAYEHGRTSPTTETAARLREVPFTRIFKHIHFTPADIAEISAKGREGIMAPLDSPRHPSSGRGVL